MARKPGIQSFFHRVSRLVVSEISRSDERQLPFDTRFETCRQVPSQRAISRLVALDSAHQISLTLTEKVPFERLRIPDCELRRSRHALLAFSGVDNTQYSEAADVPRRITILSEDPGFSRRTGLTKISTLTASSFCSCSTVRKRDACAFSCASSRTD